MLFLNPWLLAGLAAAAIPIIIHLVRQQAAKPVNWGAMQFLFDTISVRRRKMEWEDLLLMAARCLLLALVAVAVARPFIPPNSSVPWLLVLPAALLGIALCGASVVLSKAGPRWIVRVVGIALLAAAAAMVIWEKQLNLKRFEASGRRDVAIVIDASSSMDAARDGKTNFQRAVEEARELVKEAPAGTAFSVILGGPAPEARTAAPVTHRADVLGILDKLELIGGPFRAHEAIGMATLGLAEGTSASKEIVVFTDGQRSGWRFDNPSAWEELENAWAAMPAKPKLLVRDFGAPPDFRNLAVSALEISRPVVGTDREVTLRVTIENTGAVAITAEPAIIEIDGRKIGEMPVGLLAPGQSEILEFRHRFTRGGPQVVEARLDQGDDLAADNRYARVVAVRGTLPVLLVDGNPAGGFFDRAAGYTALALAPSTALMAGKTAAADFLMDPRVVAVTALREEDLDDAAVIVLADVSRLPEKLAASVAAKVTGGAGLVVLAGPRADEEFYNGWKGADGPMLPLPLGPQAASVDGISPAPSTFSHESLQWFATSGDLGEARVTRWRETGPPIDGGVQAAAFSNGQAFLATRTSGSGRCVLATCAFDARAGNLPSRRAFVPLAHELVTWAAGGGADLNVAAAWSPAFSIDTSAGGLTAKYFRTRKEKEGGISRIDPAIDFDWRRLPAAREFPREQFSVRWSATLVPPVTGTYRLEAEVDDRLELTIGGGTTRSARLGAGDLGMIELTAGERVPVEALYEQDGGEGYVRLFWTPPGGKREIIPSSAWVPTTTAAPIALTAVDPRGLPRTAAIRSSRRGRELAIDGAAVPGVFQISGASELEAAFPGMQDGMLPVAVARDPAESRFEPMTIEDFALIRQRIDLLQPGSLADILGVLQGKGFGREIWKLLAVAAFFLLLLESALARWVSRARRAGEDVRVEFGEATLWRGGC